MGKKIKITIALILVLTMVVGMGLSPYRAEGVIDTEESEEIVDPETLENPEEPVDPGEIDPDPEPGGDPVDPIDSDPVDSEDPTVPVDPEDPNNPTEPEGPGNPDNPDESGDPENPVDPDSPGDTENPTEPVDPETPEMLPYTVIYFIDEIEAPEYQINDFVTLENPVVEEVPDFRPEHGYIIDEDMSTELPFTVTEEDNIIEVYYVKQLQRVTPFGIAAPGYYESDDEGIVVKTKLEGESINTHTIPELIWYEDGIVYAAVKSTHELEHMTLNGVKSTVFDEYNSGLLIYVDGQGYDPKNGLQGNTKDARWTVFKFNLSQLPIPKSGRLDFFVKSQKGEGHDVGGYMTVIVPVEDIIGDKEWIGGENWPEVTLQLQRQVGFGPLEIVSAGTVDGIVDANEATPWSYTWYDMPEYNPYGQPYIYSIDEVEVPKNYEKSKNGMTVTNTYTPPGELTITKYVSGGHDSNQEFDIFVYGNNGKVYVVTLKDGDSITLEDLEYATYTIVEIVPMNYGLVGISDNQITLDRLNNIASVEVYNERTNDGWFYDDDTRINSFRVGVTRTSKKEDNNLGYYYFINETILPEEIIYRKRVFI